MVCLHAVSVNFWSQGWVGILIISEFVTYLRNTVKQFSKELGLVKQFEFISTANSYRGFGVIGYMQKVMLFVLLEYHIIPFN